MNLDALVHPKESVYFIISLIVSLIICLSLIFSIVGIMYIVIGALISLMVHGLLIGSLKGNGIRLSESQFPEAYRFAQELSKQMGLDTVPEIYIIQSGGVLNAFATRFLGRNFVVIYSNVLELAYEQGEDALAFVVGHELAHHKRGHLSKRWMILPSTFIPFLPQAYSRACEYTCDRISAHFQPVGAEKGLLVLAAGTKLYNKVNIAEYKQQSATATGFWVWLAEILATHPNLPKRLKALKPVSSPVSDAAMIST